MNKKVIQSKTTKEVLTAEFSKVYVQNGSNPRLLRVSMSEALNNLKITNSTVKVSTGTLESLLQWIDV